MASKIIKAPTEVTFKNPPAYNNFTIRFYPLPKERQAPSSGFWESSEIQSLIEEKSHYTTEVDGYFCKKLSIIEGSINNNERGAEGYSYIFKKDNSFVAYDGTKTLTFPGNGIKLMAQGISKDALIKFNCDDGTVILDNFSQDVFTVGSDGQLNFTVPDEKYVVELLKDINNTEGFNTYFELNDSGNYDYAQESYNKVEGLKVEASYKPTPVYNYDDNVFKLNVGNEEYVCQPDGSVYKYTDYINDNDINSSENYLFIYNFFNEEYKINDEYSGNTDETQISNILSLLSILRKCFFEFKKVKSDYTKYYITEGSIIFQESQIVLFTTYLNEGKYYYYSELFETDNMSTELIETLRSGAFRYDSEFDEANDKNVYYLAFHAFDDKYTLVGDYLKSNNNDDSIKIFGEGTPFVNGMDRTQGIIDLLRTDLMTFDKSNYYFYKDKEKVTVYLNRKTATVENIATNKGLFDS